MAGEGGGPGRVETVRLPAEALVPVGLGRDEGMIPYPTRAFPGYRLIQEYFAFPHKFLFADLGGWDRMRAAGFAREVEVVFFLDELDEAAVAGVQADTFRLGCTPAVNLFSQLAEPIRLTHQRYEYPVIPDGHHPLGMEVYSVDSVAGTESTSS